MSSIEPDALLVGADRVEHVGDEQPVDDEPAIVAGRDRGLAELLADLEAEVDGLVGGVLGPHDLEQRHHLRRIEEVEPDHPLGPLRRVSLSRDRERGRVGGEEGVVLDDLVELAPHLELAVEVLCDRLDHEVRVGEIRVVERRRDPADHGVSLVLLHLALLDGAGELLLDLPHALVEGRRILLPHDDVPPRLGADLRDPVAHEPAAHDADLADRHISLAPRFGERARVSATPLLETSVRIRSSTFLGSAGRNRQDGPGFLIRCVSGGHKEQRSRLPC